jgi:predicted dienelactone hydrolase
VGCAAWWGHPSPRAPTPSASPRIALRQAYTKSEQVLRLLRGTMNLACAQLWLPSSTYLHGMVQYATNVDEGSLLVRAAAGVLVAALTPLRLLVRMDNAAWGAPPVEPPVQLPVVVFSHGLAGFRNMYGSLCSQLAVESGALVAAVEHTDGSACAASMRDFRWVQRTLLLA